MIFDHTARVGVFHPLRSKVAKKIKHVFGFKLADQAATFRQWVNACGID